MTFPTDRLDVNFSERHAAVLELARQSVCFDVRLVRFRADGYLIDDAALAEHGVATTVVSEEDTRRSK